MAEIIYREFSYAVQGALFEVHNELRHLRLSEAGWENALLVALANRGIPAESQVEYALYYKGYRVGRFWIDVVAGDEEKIVLELKRTNLMPVHEAQLINYLKLSGLKLGILVSFGGQRVVFRRLLNCVDMQPEPSWRRVRYQVPERLPHLELVHEILAVLEVVMKELGPGFMHVHYRRACQVELRLREVPFEVRRDMMIRFRGHPIERHWVRFLEVNDGVLLAPIAVRQVSASLRSRYQQYLHNLGLEVGVIANFHSPELKIEILRP